MIISASYRTDIPAFYGEWFVNRLRAGYCKVANPYNKHISRIALDAKSVDGFVFWTKNLGPFLGHLPEVAAFARPFMVQYTINGYPRELERAVTPPEQSIRHVKEVVQHYGAGTVVWRYDTIVFSSLTPLAFHIENFGKLLDQLAGLVDEVVVSFMQLYKKTKRNMNAAATKGRWSWSDPDDSQKTALLRQLVNLAQARGVVVSVCAQPEKIVPGAVEARCVDARRLTRLSGRRIQAAIRGGRKECGCFESRDIGDYNTCPQGCIYCYAVENWAEAKRRYAKHDPASDFLYEPPPGAVEEPKSQVQLPLIGES